MGYSIVNSKDIITPNDRGILGFIKICDMLYYTLLWFSVNGPYYANNGSPLCGDYILPLPSGNGLIHLACNMYPLSKSSGAPESMIHHEARGEYVNLKPSLGLPLSWTCLELGRDLMHYNEFSDVLCYIDTSYTDTV